MPRSTLRSSARLIGCADQIMRFAAVYGSVLQRESSSPGGVPSIHCMHSTFFNRLSNRGQRTAVGGARTTGYNYDYVRTWTRRVDLFSKQLIVFPINIDNVHWCLAVARLGATRNLGNTAHSSSLDECEKRSRQ